MTLKQLEAFYWAATCSSFAMAAERAFCAMAAREPLGRRVASQLRAIRTNEPLAL